MRRFQQKLIIPAASRPLIERFALIERLEQSITTMRVVALAAPAGWGKTTAVAQWAAQTALPVAWYALDPADGDPSLFLDYLLHVVVDYAPDARDLIARLAGAGPDEIPQLCHAAALAVAAAPHSFALVLDDFHLLSEAPSATGLSLIQSLLSSIAEYAPNCHLVVASRTPPALYGMVRLIAQQRAAVFDYTALQFTSSEVQRLAGASAGVMLSNSRASDLTVKLGGWVTGIVLSLDQAIIRRNSAPIDLTIATDGDDIVRLEASTTQVYAFLAEQVIAPIPSNVQSFLEETCVLDFLSPRRCDELRESTDSGMLLDQIRQYGLFTTSRAGWLAYHSLLRDFLRTRLARDPARERRLLIRAGMLYAREDELESAVSCYLAAQSIESAVDLMRDAAVRFRRLSRHTTLLTCFDHLAAARSGPLPADLLIIQAHVYADLANWEHAYLSIQLAEAIGVGELAWEAQLAHADFLSTQGRLDAAQEMLGQLPVTQLPDRLGVQYFLHAGQIQILSGAPEGGLQHIEQAYNLSMQGEVSRDPSLLAEIHDNLGWAYSTLGNRPLALRHMQRADACWQVVGNSGRRASTLNNIGVTQMDEGLRTDARNTFELGLTIARSTGRRRIETALLCSLADLDLSEGGIEQSLARFDEAHTLAERIELFDLAGYAAAGACWVAALSGDLQSAERWSAGPPEASGDPIVLGRLELAGVLRMHQRAMLDPAVLAKALDRVAAVVGEVGSAERAYFQLARAALLFQRADWAMAQEAWGIFEQQAMKLPTPLLSAMAGAHDPLLAAAASSSPFAQQLRRLTGKASQRRWKICALGRFNCRAEGQPCELSQLHRTILTRLLDAGPAGLAVDRLWESVWGDDEISMTALHQAMRRLRLQTGLSVAVRDGFCAIWSDWDDIEYDVRTLEDLLATPLTSERVEQVLAIYRGDFLPGAWEGAHYWVDTRRSHLQERLLDALERYAVRAEADHPQAALQIYQRILQIDGCREQTAVRLMQIAARFGNRSLVTSTFEHLTGALRVLGSTPGASTAAIYRQLH
jgi:ATP/maltotriose-dependent transcriptional regulator MalT/DNA-binding SARP family transcriptional activator